MEMIKNIFHEHPLTLCENEKNNGQLVCHGCGNRCFGESYSCTNCGFYPNTCSACNKEVTSGSYYICELCWPQSPLFHQSCVDLPEEFQITYYLKGCFFKLIKESSGGSVALHCDFCDQEHSVWLFKYCCELCDYQICVGCTSMLIKYHQDQPQVEHFIHGHPLTLLKLDHIMNCKMCLKSIDDGQGYGCAPCEFYIHSPSCRDEFPQEIRHPFHQRHRIKLSVVVTGEYKCTACTFTIQGLRYGSDKCRFDLHPECTSLKPNIKQKGHPHLLIHVENLSYQSNCEACGSGIRGVPFRRCVQCRLDFHINCGPDPIPPTALKDNDDCKSHESQEGIEHFSHEHPLITSEVADFGCKFCYKNINGICYGCAAGCDFYIHISCSEFPQEIPHGQFRPPHFFKLSAVEKPTNQCRACCFKIQGFRYRCDVCDFGLHPECTSMKATIEYECHEHLLTLIENETYDGECEACGNTTNGAFFMRCVECSFNFHVLCGPRPLPPTVLVNQHEHRLTQKKETLTEDNFDQPYCTICKTEINQKHHSIYYYADCESYAHIRCVIIEYQLEETEKMIHFSHRHPLFLLEKKRNYDIICIACKKNIQVDLAHGCYRCKFYLHKSCAEQPRKKKHPFHRHPLTLAANSFGNYHQCNACYKRYKGFSYCCKGCNFNLDLDCSVLLPSIKLGSLIHDHTVTLFKQLYGSIECHGYKLIPPNRVTSLKLGALYVRCVKCNFNRHLLCCPLPKTIQLDDIHHHRLTLKDNFDDFDDGEYCCDVCEIRRDSEECVYHCEECHFVVDLECVYSEVMKFLEGKRKDLKRSINRKISRKRKGLTYNDMVKSLTEEEKKSLTALEEKLMEGNLLDLLDELKVMNMPTLEDWTEKTLKSGIKEWMEKIMRVDEKVEDYELVQVGAYKISRIYASTLKNLLEKYKDFGASCPLAQNMKSMILPKLCWIMNDMSEFLLMEIDDYSIIMWWFWLKVVEKAGFMVDFALDHVKSRDGKYPIRDG